MNENTKITRRAVLSGLSIGAATSLTPDRLQSETLYFNDVDSARNLTQHHAADVLQASNVNVPIYPSLASASDATIVADVKGLRTQFYSPSYGIPATLVGGANYARASLAAITAANYPALAYFRSRDRFTPDGSTDATDGGYWLLTESVIDLRMLGGGLGDAFADTAALKAAVQIVDGLDRGIIRLPPTPITINRTIEIALGRFDIEGFGRDVSPVISLIIGAPLFRSVGDVVRVGFKGFKCIGNGLTGASGNGHAFALFDTNRRSGASIPQLVTMEQITIDGFRGNDTEGAPSDSSGTINACAVNNKGALGCTFRDIEVLNCGGGFYMGRTQNCLIDNPTISGCDCFGVYDYQAASLRITGGDIQDSTVGTPLTVPVTVSAGNIISYQGSGTVVSGTKTKNAGGNAQVYVREGRGVKIEKMWVQTTMTENVPHKGIIFHKSVGLGITDCTFELAQSAYVATQKHTSIEITNDGTDAPVSGEVRGNQFNYPPGMDIASLIRVAGDSRNRKFAGLVIEGNTIGNRAAPSSGLTVNDGILIENANLIACKIANNVFHAQTGVTIVNGIRFHNVTDGGKNEIGQNAFLLTGTGAIINEYVNVTESELKGSLFINPASMVTGTSQTFSVIVAGAVRGDIVMGAAFGAELLGCTLSAASIITDGHVDVVISNNTGMRKDPGSGVLTVLVKKRLFS
ncbi:right-handed parallel beta-helix repeat-containing protein [Mesorhizobium sp.]|uniref:right-handed parallel beta-helix repeat-containing protein n=1 Tax=Mesorhizobium sp. TaxID=1871066 RepID=UPI000FE7AD3B|nr:right-handed parallel beta-helix repeat-containing protein [Mesorhizobium sp.]RWB06302.1 MAG: hypothetical protein EOQ33_06220 [Mesorhizobium sp.]